MECALYGRRITPFSRRTRDISNFQTRLEQRVTDFKSQLEKKSALSTTQKFGVSLVELMRMMPESARCPSSYSDLLGHCSRVASLCSSELSRQEEALDLPEEELKFKLMLLSFERLRSVPRVLISDYHERYGYLLCRGASDAGLQMAEDTTDSCVTPAAETRRTELILALF